MRAPNTAPLASRRRESSRLAILDAALSLCREEGYARLSIEAIAARAGVGKGTIYRWWPSKGAVLLEALDREAAGWAAFPDTGDLVADMRTTINDVVRFQSNPNFGPPLAALIAEAQQDPAIGPLLLERFFRPRRAPIVERLRRAPEGGPPSETPGGEGVLEGVFGRLFHRLLPPNGAPDTAFPPLLLRPILP